jgi:hypothetical protein
MRVRITRELDEQGLPQRGLTPSDPAKRDDAVLTPEVAGRNV